MGHEPLAEVITSKLDGAVGLVARVDLAVDDMRLGECRAQVGVDMVGKGAKGLVVPVEAMDVNDEQGATLIRVGDGRVERLGRRGAWIYGEAMLPMSSVIMAVGCFGGGQVGRLGSRGWGW